VQRADGQRLFQRFNGLVELLHLAIADTFEVERISIARIELRRLLKTGQGRFQFIVGVLRETEVIPSLWIVRIERNGIFE